MKLNFTGNLSDQLAEITDPNTYNLLNPRDLEGRVRVAYFSGTSTSDECLLTVVPKGARIIGGTFVGSADSSLEFREFSSSNVASGNPLVVLASSSAGHNDLSDSDGFGEVLQWDGALLLTSDAPSEEFRGVLLYVVD